MPAVARSRPGPQGFWDPSVVAAGERDARIVRRVLFEVDLLRLLVQPIEVVGRLILPACVGYQRPVRPQSVEQGAHDGLRTADHATERGHPTMNHRHPARPQPEVLQIPSEPRTRHQHVPHGSRSGGDRPTPMMASLERQKFFYLRYTRGSRTLRGGFDEPGFDPCLLDLSFRAGAAPLCWSSHLAGRASRTLAVSCIGVWNTRGAGATKPPGPAAHRR